MMRLAGMMIDMHNEDANFAAGETVQITDGPFESFKGEIDWIESSSGEVGLLVQIFGKQTPIVVTMNQIKRS